MHAGLFVLPRPAPALVQPHPPPRLQGGHLHRRVGVLQNQFGFGLRAVSSRRLVERLSVQTRLTLLAGFIISQRDLEVPTAFSGLCVR
jgi:hypothetical protein